jgi:hypothetical protein
VPRSEETWPDYNYWHALATEYGDLAAIIRKIRKEHGGEPYLEDPGTADSIYSAGSDKAVRGNLRYLRQNVLPPLKAALQDRKSSIELTTLWGEFNRIVYSLPGAGALAKKRHEEKLEQARKAIIDHERAVGGRKNNKDAQLKWYLHWRRRYVNELGWSVKQSDFTCLDVAFKIASGVIPPPRKFPREWFRAAYGERLKTGERAKTKKPSLILPDRLAHSGNDKARDRLLESGSDEEPTIPPLDPSAYPGADFGAP